MGLTDDPFYKNMTEGEDTHILVGTLTTRMRGPNSARTETLPVFLVDYHPSPQDMETIIAQTFDPLKKINLDVKNGTYTLSEALQVAFSKAAWAGPVTSSPTGSGLPGMPSFALYPRRGTDRGVSRAVV